METCSCASSRDHFKMFIKFRPLKNMCMLLFCLSILYESISTTEKKPHSNMNETLLAEALVSQKYYKKLPLFVHVHKSGGTMMCQSAIANGETVNRNDNCNLIGDGPNTITEKSISMTCHERYVMAKEANFSFVAIERFLLDDLDGCKDLFLTILVVRNPIQRHFSHVANHERKEEREKKRKKKRIKQKKRPQFHLGEALVDLDYSKDNYLTRILLGIDGFNGNIPVGSINDLHLKRALKTLQKFDVTLCLENFTDDRIQLQHYLKWTKWAGVVGADPQGKSRKRYSSELKNRNTQDLTLYRHACVLSRKRNEKINSLNRRVSHKSV